MAVKKLPAEPTWASSLPPKPIEPRGSKSVRYKSEYELLSGTYRNPVSGEKAGGSQLTVPSESGETSEPPTEAFFSGSTFGPPNLFRPFAQFVYRPYLVVIRCSPVTRSSTKK